MVLLGILRFKGLLPFCTNPIFLASIPYQGSSSRSVINSSHFFLINGGSTLAVGNSKQVEPKSLPSISLNPSVDSQANRTPRPNFVRSKKGNLKENELPETSSSFIFRSMQEKKFPEELSPNAVLLMSALNEELHRNLKPNHFPTNYPSRHLLTSAAETFGNRHQRIAKWLSGSDLKRIALFGCPSVERKTVFASKRLRSFFCIKEDIICSGCKIKASCNFVNQRVDKVDRVILADVMRLLTVLAFDAVPEQLSVPDDLKLSVDKLLKEAVNLSQ